MFKMTTHLSNAKSTVAEMLTFIQNWVILSAPDGFILFIHRV